MKILTDVDGDEVSLVRRAANKRRFLLLKGDTVDAEINDMLDVPYGREGALLDEIRKDGVDETVEKAAVYAIRLLKGIEGELSPETIEKLGNELYPHQNPGLNVSGGVRGVGELTGAAASPQDDDAYEGDAAGPDKDGSGRDGELEGEADGVELADQEDDDEDDVKKADKSRAKSWITRRAKALGATSTPPEDADSVAKADDDVTDEERGTVEIPVPIRKEDGTWDLSGVPEESRAFFSEMIEKADKTSSDLAEAREQLQKSEDALLTRRMVEKAARLSHVAAADDLAPVLKEASLKLDEETFGKLEDVFKAAEERISKGHLFEEYGRASGQSGDTSKDDVYSQLVEKANEIVEKGTDLSFEAAFDKAMQQNPALYDRYVSEKGWIV